MTTRLRRSMLYVPGDSEKMLERATGIASDALLLNLEDGVAASRKEAARENVARALRRLDFGPREVVVRVNWSVGAIGGVGERDLVDIVPCAPDGICIPKVESGREVEAADRALMALETRHDIPAGSIRLHAMIESAAGVLRAQEIAAASDRMASLIFGSADYIADVRCRPRADRSELGLALQMIVTSARAAGIDAIDAPCFDIPNHDLLTSEAETARRIGFDGKSVLHPGQLEIINRVFDVSPEEIAWAEKVIAELDEAERRGKALTTVDGQLFDNPHRAAAERILSRRRPA